MAIESTNELDLFYDTNATRPSVTGVTITENTLNSSKYLSGVRFYSETDVFSVNLTANNVYSNTYSATQVYVNPSQFATDNFTLNNSTSGVTGPASPPHLSNGFTYNGTMTADNTNIWYPDARASAYSVDPFGSGSTVESPSSNYMVYSYGNYAEENSEYFRDERYRLPDGAYNSVPGNILDQWPSGSVLINGNAQVWPNALRYPNTNYTSGYYPAQAGNYSAFSGSQKYLRAFKDAGTPHTNIIMTLGGWAVSAWPYGSIQVEFKLPTQTGWLRGDIPYNVATFTGVDGDGCYVSSLSSGSSFYFSFGSFSTASSGYLVIMRITYTNSGANELQQMQATNW